MFAIIFISFHSGKLGEKLVSSPDTFQKAVGSYHSGFNPFTC